MPFGRGPCAEGLEGGRVGLSKELPVLSFSSCKASWASHVGCVCFTG